MLSGRHEFKNGGGPTEADPKRMDPTATKIPK